VIAYKYETKDVFLVAEADKEIIIGVLRDGKPLGDEAGSDVLETSDGRTILKIKDAGLYKVIRDDRSEIHLLEFIIQTPGLRAYTFTFG
jgi:hypothetical protein